MNKKNDGGRLMGQQGRERGNKKKVGERDKCERKVGQYAYGMNWKTNRESYNTGLRETERGLAREYE